MNQILLGFIIGIVLGLITLSITIFQIYPKWKNQGFAYPKSKEEWTVVKKYWDTQKKNISKYIRNSIIFYLILFYIGWYYPLIIIYTGTLFFMTVLIVFLIITIVVDPFVRKK